MLVLVLMLVLMVVRVCAMVLEVMLGDSFGGSGLEGLGVADGSVCSVAGGLEDLEAVAGVGVGGGVGRGGLRGLRRRRRGARHGWKREPRGCGQLAMGDVRRIPGCLMNGVEAR